MNEFITVARFRDLPEAELARGKLEAEGIPAFLADKYLVGLCWTYSYAIGGIKLQVPQGLAEEARNVLDTDNSAEVSESQPLGLAVSQDIACPSCGSANVLHSKLSRKSGAISLLLGLPILFWGTRFSCKQCSHSWTPERHREPFPDIPAAIDPDETALSKERKEKAWGDSLPLIILILMGLICIVMLYQYTK